MHRSFLNTLGPYIKHETTYEYLRMHRNSNIHTSWIFDFTPTDDTLFNNCILEENRPGIVNMNLVYTPDFQVKDLSEGARNMCEPGVSVGGGGSAISEAVSYEAFHRWKGAELVLVSWVWLCHYCDVFFWDEV